MEILIESVLQNARRFGYSVHIRYLERKGKPVERPGNGGNGKEVAVPAKPEGGGRSTSYVIIHRSYSYLEPVVRSMFEGAEDVRVVLDRRFLERRQAANSRTDAEDRRKLDDRRHAVPMLDIFIHADP